MNDAQLTEQVQAALEEATAGLRVPAGAAARAAGSSLWEAAADAGLPVALHIETGTGVDSAPTPSGPPRTYPQYVGFMGLNYIYHLMNMIAEGVF